MTRFATRTIAAVGTVKDMVNVGSVIRTLATLAPLFILYAATHDRHWLSASIVAISLVIAIERVGLTTAGAFMQGGCILAVFLALSLALPRPPIFMAGCAIASAASIAVTAWGERLRTVGNFVFIPALYLTCEAAESRTVARELLPYLAGGAVPPLVLTIALHCHRNRAHIVDLRGMLRRLHGEGSLGRPVPMRRIVEASLAVMLAVASMAFVVQWWHWGHAQWAIWSAASVVTGDAVSAHRKLLDRATGALLGAPIGVAIGMLLPHDTFWYTFASLRAILTLVAFRRYVVAFGTRCACIACAGWIASGAAAIAVERVTNVIAGGIVGLTFVFLARRMVPSGPRES